MNKDPVVALDMMKNSTHTNIIHDIGRSPFSVHYFLSEQAAAYKKLSAIQDVSMCMSATGLNLLNIEKNMMHTRRKVED